MYPVQLISDLHIEGENFQIDVLSNESEIAVAISGASIPKIGLPLRQLISIARKQPFSTEQVISIVYNQKEIYHSGKSLLSRFNYFFLFRTLFKNMF
ncbi:hypothetical protein A33Q_0153 [Indibacter alkaliphilus LW1]|jgi:hypothetical protein|uniref:Uncharacterized protein n=1 Tax=Indibacter alkaliphilus (strain CCUG 57479 / KCTC 22604 / LW1) TaxID=1189612 RepID=S2E6M9_INDAL|nr:hypothetical protein [Indibacter alkaliphilus]EPA00282.1 hypothetical protein A33Q_0153 [Indibacter alkaliphilus LW1]